MSDVPTKIVIPSDGSGDPPYEVPITPEEQVQMEAERASHAKGRVGQQQAISADVERLGLIRERAETDPAFAALADLALGGKGL